MSTYVPYVIKNSGAVTMYLNGESATVEKDHPNYNLIIDCLKTGRHEKLDALVNIAKAVKSYVAKSTDRVKIVDGVITYDGVAIHSTLTMRILKMMNEGYQFEHMLRFFQNLMENPSKRAVQELYTFLENYGLPITEDGCFLAYKAVRNDYFDIYTGRTHKNTVGSVQKMARNLVDDDWGRDCSQGLHCGALSYVVDYGRFIRGQIVANDGNRLVIVKVNPRDVVSVPNFDKFTKMRVCEYTVIDEIAGNKIVTELEKAIYKAGDVTPVAPDRKMETEDTVKSDMSEADKKRTMLDEDDSLEDYGIGYNDGAMDLRDGDGYGYTRDYDGTDAYRKGYNDGYNGRANQVDSDDADDEEVGDNGDEHDCGCGCGCGCQNSVEGVSDEDGEYAAGYSVGQDDSEAGNGYQTSLEIDDTDSFKAGYSDGYNDAEAAKSL